MKQGHFFNIWIIVILLFNGHYLYAQSKQDLEAEKRNNLERLKISRQLLESTREERKNSIYQLDLLNRQIDIRNSLIGNYATELKELEDNLDQIEYSIKENSASLERLKNEYAGIVKSTYRNIEENYFWMYILSSEDINQGYERIRYIKYLNDYRKTLFKEIQSANDSLIILKVSLNDIKIQKELALIKIQEENARLNTDRKSKSLIVNRLKGKESDILKEIREREESQRKIENEIRRIIEAEARKARSANKMYELTPEERIISDDFTKNRGGLPWPTIQGIITGNFGEHNHPVIPGIKIRSNGIDISTVPGTEVRAIFKGEVTVVSAILGANYTVIIKHGNYRSVYQNLVNVKVKQGDIIDTKEAIGNVGTNTNNESKLHFELWNGMTVIDPQVWLSK